MNKREKKILIDRYVQVKNLVEWHDYKLNKRGDSMSEDDLAFIRSRHAKLDHEALTLGSLGHELGLWDAMWDAYWDQRVDRTY
jgi:hypothetical protein